MDVQRHRWLLAAAAAALLVVAAAGAAITSQAPVLAAGGLLHPARRPVTIPAPSSCIDETFDGAGVKLEGWRCRPTAVSAGAAARRGTIVYLHGVADNRTSGGGLIQRFGARGFDVVAYDSRAHGESGGDICTYGAFEKHDLRLVVDTLEPGPVILLGGSLGAAVALQTAAIEPRVTAVIAVESFSDLRTVARERAPGFVTAGMLQRALAAAEQRGGFRVDDISPLRAAAAIVAPVLLVHGEQDVDTPPSHARRVFAALRGPRRLLLVPGAAHNESLRPEVWDEIETWIDGVVGSAEIRR